MKPESQFARKHSEVKLNKTDTWDLQGEEVQEGW